MISILELNRNDVPLTPEMQANLSVLHDRINVIRMEWARPMIVTSGVRSREDQKRIYTDIAKRKGVAVIRIPMGSRHLTAQACDIEDRDGSLMLWCQANVSLLEQTGLWCEAGTVGWVHFQTVAPTSGNRFFKP